MKKKSLRLTIFVVLAFIAVFSFSSCRRPEQDAAAATVFAGSHSAAGVPAPGLGNLRIAYFVAAPGEEQAATWNIQESDDPFTIVDFGPRDELPAEIRRPAIFVAFSQPVVPLARLGEVIREDAGLFTIEPPLSGIFRWYGTRLLAFEPDVEILPQMEYRVTVSDRIRSLGGKSLEGERSFTFETARLRVVNWDLGDGETWVNRWDASPEDARVSRFIFSHPVNLNEIANWIEISVGGRTFPFTLSRLLRIDERRFRPEQGVLLTLNENLPPNSNVTVRVLQGARSESNWLGTREDIVFNFQTLRPFRFNQVSVRSDARPRTAEGDSIPISLHFSHAIDPDISPSLFSVQGMPPLTSENLRVFGSTVVISRLPLEYERNYLVNISGDVRDLWGRTLGQAQVVQASVGPASSYVFFLNRGPGMLEAAFPPKVIWETQNPVSIRSGIAAASGPYERFPVRALVHRDVSALQDNSKHFFIEDLSPFLGPGGRGTVAMGWEFETRSQWQRDRTFRGDNWLTVQVTDLGITLRYAYNRVLVWVTRLSTGESVSGATVELMEGNTVVRTGNSDARGLAVFQFSPGEFNSLFNDLFPHHGVADWNRGFRVRVSEGGGAMAGGDQAEFIPNGSHNLWRFRVEAAETPFEVERERPLIFLFTDRGLYRPGETVSFRGIDRNLRRGQFSPYYGYYTIEVTGGGHNVTPIASFQGRTTSNGGSHGSFTLPENLDPGHYFIRYTRRSNNFSQTITFIVANFERLRFEASLGFNEPFSFQGERISARLSASYLAGGAVAGAQYSYFWSREPAIFNPGASWRNWRFGPEVWDGRFFVASGQGDLGPDGSGGITHNAQADGIEGLAYRYFLDVSVQDAARQEISVRASTLVHPAYFYIASRLDTGTLRSADLNAARPSAHFLQAGSPSTVSWALITPEGELLDQRSITGEQPAIHFTLVRHEWRQSRQAGVGGRIHLNWERVEEVVIDRSIIPGRGEFTGVIPFTPAYSGQWEVRLSSRDSRGRVARTSYSFFVSGAGWVHWGWGDADSITLTPDQPSYAPGETARILVQSPLPRGKYLLTLEREGIIQERIIELDGSARTIDIPIEESFIPIVYVAISSFTTRTGPPTHTYFEPDLDKPRGIFGLTSLFVNPDSRRYTIEIETSRAVYGPGEEAEVALRVSHNGRPAPGVELSFMAVDRGVLDLIDYRVPDPLAFFYSPWNFPLGVRGADSRSLLIDPVTYSIRDLQGGDKNGEARDAGSAVMDERQDFRPTAVFEPFLVSGPDGTVRVRFTLPDSLTTYRATAVAAGISNFGIAEQDIRVSAPLTAIPVLPRQLRWRDTGTVSLLLTNLDNSPVEATVSVETEVIHSGLWDTVLEIDGTNQKTVRINPGASAEVSFLAAALGAGESRVIFTLRSPLVNERIIRTLRVERPVVYETVTSTGSLGNENPFIEEGLILPSLVPEGTGSLSVSLSASRLALLQEAVQFLIEPTYRSIEQRTAKLLPLIAFADHLDAFQLPNPIEDSRRLIEDSLLAIANSQLRDGSFPFWPGGRHGNAFVTLRVAHIVALARQRGFEIPAELDIQAMLRFITNQGANNRVFARDPFLKGYSLWVRTMFGARIGTEINAFLRQGDELGISGWGFAGLAALELGMTDLAITTRDRIRRFIRPGTRTLDLTDTFERGMNFWGFDTDRFAIALMLFHALSPDDDMTTRLVNTLIERQRRGVWNSSASSYWAVLAFSRIADAEAQEGVDLNARLSLANTRLMEAAFTSYGGVPASQSWRFAETPLDLIERDTLLPLRIEREGSGRLYYTVSLRYGIPSELAAPRDEGLGVFAETFDSSGNPVRDGVLVPGRTYTRRVTVSSPRDRSFVALRVPIPSGAEIVDATFVTAARVPPPRADERVAADRWEDRIWNWEMPPIRFIMDNEAVFHWEFFPAGKREIEFRFRAVMPGIYPTPPPHAECMFEPEIFGRGVGELIRIGTVR